MVDSLHIPSNSTTSSKKQSVISKNKPNCGGGGVTNKDEKKPQNIKPEQNEGNSDVIKMPKREITPDIISGAMKQKTVDEIKPQVVEDNLELVTNQKEMKVDDNNKLDEKTKQEAQQRGAATTGDDGADKNVDLKEDDHSLHSVASTPAKNLISSEEEAKARIAEKRREMKEKMEREADLERQRQVTNVL